MTMNPDTRVAVFCYQGDAHQVQDALQYYRQHGCPVTVVSPADSPVVFDAPPDVDFIHGGGVGYIGQVSLDRQAIQMEMLLKYPETHFLMHDSDSVILDPKIPDYLYKEPDIVWSNQVFDDIPEHQTTFEEGWPHVAFQPPYFLSRKTIQAMIAVKDDPRVQATPVMPFIDYYMVQLTMVAGLPWKRFLDCISCPIAIDLRKLHPSARDVETYGMGMKIAMEAVGRGAIVLHSVKNVIAINKLMDARAAFTAGTPNHTPRPTPAPHVGGRRRGYVAGPPPNRAPQTGQKA